jgi:hypothetical protein
MSLRLFHLFFIALSVVLVAFCAAWAIGMYRSGHEIGYLAAGVACALAGAGLIAYGVTFQRKTRALVGPRT